MKKLALDLLSMAVVTAANAHEYHELKVSKFEVKYSFVYVHLNDTTKGDFITCAAYDKDNKLLVSGQWVTANLATAAQIQYNGRKDKVKSVRCAYN